jgi:hypothetical protein
MTEAIIEVGPANRGPQIKAKLAEYGQQAADLILQNGLLLREYQSGGYYKEDGHKNFDEAIEAMKNAGLLDYGARQARHFIAIINMVETLNIGLAAVGGRDSEGSQAASGQGSGPGYGPTGPGHADDDRDAEGILCRVY